ncbi:MAG: hypothetical protein H7321_07670, partial [Bacteroidia bacterium]|nr:hypothetical protein [Bacteroidia bacterium]
MATKKNQSFTNPKSVQRPSLAGVKTIQGDSLLEKYAWHIVIAISIIGFIVRFYNIGYLTLWVDEYMHAMAAKNFKLHDGSILGTEKNG